MLFSSSVISETWNRNSCCHKLLCCSVFSFLLKPHISSCLIQSLPHFLKSKYHSSKRYQAKSSRVLYSVGPVQASSHCLGKCSITSFWASQGSVWSVRTATEDINVISTLGLGPATDSWHSHCLWVCFSFPYKLLYTVRTL